MTKPKQVICVASDCTNVLPEGRKKYCSDRCSNRIRRRATRANKKTTEFQSEKTLDGAISERRGKFYAICKELGYFDKIISGEMTQQQVADAVSTSRANISRSLAAYYKDLEAERKQQQFKKVETKTSVDDFLNFRDTYFLTERGEPYDTPDFQQEWIKAILESIDTGGRLMILSPPRHGKTDLLTHFCVYVICRNPNIRVMWVGGNEDIAKNAVSSVLDHLEGNDKLIEDFCGPGRSFKPENRSGKSWSSSQFTVATRTVTGIKSPTLVAVGKGGKILSRDADLIVADDIEDHSTTVQPSARENTRNWWTTTLQSRKEEHTGMVVIGSRQHPDDLYSHILDNNVWSSIVERAHDLEVPLEDPDVDHSKHMLWPGKRTHKWLLEQLHAAETTSGRNIFEMVYLNKAIPDGMQLFTPEAVDSCLDRSRKLGDIPPHTSLIAGLDPASTGYQAAVLWAYNVKLGTLSLVDVRNDQGGGVSKALSLMKEWNEQYDLYHWIVEENGFQKAIRQDREIRDWSIKRGVKIEGHETNVNKWDPVFGVTAMVPLYEQGKVNLPFAEGITKRKVSIFRQQLIYFSQASAKNSRSVKTKTDLVMASWFPMKRIKTLQKTLQAQMEYDYEPSYQGLQASTMNEPFWTK